jgi:diaminopimelate decarboxylase
MAGPVAPGLDLVETPAYFYDLTEVRRAHGLLRAALPRPSELLYSVKANPHPAIVRVLAGLGCAAEVCSPGELAAALDAGVQPGRVLYTGPGKRDCDVAAALRSGVRWFSVDSAAGLVQVRRAAAGSGPPVRCLLRVNGHAAVPGQGLAMTGATSQFGADAEAIAASPGVFRDGLAGFHLYLGTNLSGEDALADQFRAAVTTARQLAGALRFEPAILNLGGGFGAPFARRGELPRFPALASRLSAQLDRDFPGWRRGRPAVVFESGRYLTATCGHLRTRVLDVKQSHGRPVVVLESGINHLGGMSGLRRLPPVTPELAAATAAGPPMRAAIIAGPLCTPLDTWSWSADLPPVRPGDVVQVPNVGAYGLSASLLAFLGHPVAREVVIDHGEITEVSQLALVRRPASAGPPLRRSDVA